MSIGPPTTIEILHFGWNHPSPLGFLESEIKIWWWHRPSTHHFSFLTWKGCRHKTLVQTSGGDSLGLWSKSIKACPSLLYNRNPIFFPGIVTFSTSWLSLILGFPLISTSLYTHPKAGCRWHVTANGKNLFKKPNQWETLKLFPIPKWVPMPKQSMEWPCSFKDRIVSSLISLEATTVKVANQGTSNSLATLWNASRATRDKYARSPESIRIPKARYPKSFKAKATLAKFSKPLLKISLEGLFQNCTSFYYETNVGQKMTAE